MADTAVVYGKRKLGADGAAAARAAAQNAAGGGAMRYGARKGGSFAQRGSVEVRTGRRVDRPQAPQVPASAIPVPPMAVPAASAAPVVPTAPASIRDLSWTDLQKQAKALGVNSSGMKRPELEAAVMVATGRVA